ncbi:tetratricopeptide repeat protein [Tumebacillus flagellatus]|uniref:HTH cro/C1-type domain-containing protein n=1 Tax=Tumebacillus flagellatus TaxID=1157490 RepID=A0A074LN50_9BACL|nr:hypothetical protein [Tumebacillus flagellatus]KEO83536.1 hypothetical protein EL26_08965 [Tumebacillus flagellatus]
MSLRSLGKLLECHDPEETMCRETLRKIMKGARHCRPSEVGKFAKAFGVTVERLKQTDTENLVSDIRRSIERKDDLQRAKKLCEYYVSIALGLSEKCDALNYLAHVVFELGDYEEAHKLWNSAFGISKVIAEKYGATQRLYAVLLKLMVSYTTRKRFTELAGVLATVEEVFHSDHEKMGVIYHSKAMIAEQFNNTNQTREYLTRSLSELELTGMRNHIGRAQVNLGYFEFKNRNYNKARGHFDEAIQNLLGDAQILPIAVKEYAKVLIKLEEFGRAVEMIEEHYHLVQERGELKGKYDILLTLANHDIRYAEKVAVTASAGKTVRALACRVLINHFSVLGDSVALMKYYRMEKKILEATDILHMEEF